MFGNLEVETQTAQHIAKNQPEKGDFFVIVLLLTYIVTVLVLFLLTPLSILGAVISAVLVTLILFVPALIIRARRRNKNIKDLEEMRKYQMASHRESL